jgi:hypothetical protein
MNENPAIAFLRLTDNCRHTLARQSRISHRPTVEVVVQRTAENRSRLKIPIAAPADFAQRQRHPEGMQP